MQTDKSVALVGIISGALLGFSTVARAVPLTSATVTETKNSVQYKPGDEAERAAKISDTIKGADVLRTGERSLAEVEFNDKSITRLGSKSVFTFTADTREFRVGQGLTLICLPKGVGGGKIVTAAITAAIEGTTVLAEEFTVRRKKDPQPRQAAKFIFLEGRGVISTPDSKQQKKIHGGQMIVHVLGDPKLADPQDIDLNTLVTESAIINAFARQLPTWDAIQAEIKRQKFDLRRGILEESPFYLVGLGTKVGQRKPHQPAGYVNLADPSYKDSGGIVALSEDGPCPCQQ